MYKYVSLSKEKLYPKYMTDPPFLSSYTSPFPIPSIVFEIIILFTLWHVFYSLLFHFWSPSSISIMTLRTDSACLFSVKPQSSTQCLEHGGCSEEGREEMLASTKVSVLLAKDGWKGRHMGRYVHWHYSSWFSFSTKSHRYKKRETTMPRTRIWEGRTVSVSRWEPGGQFGTPPSV